MRRFGTIGCFVTFTAVTLFLAMQNSNFFVSITANEPLGMAFKGNDLDRFWLACCIGVITATLLALDLTVDFILGWKPIVDDRIERISMMSLQFVRTISLLHCLQKPILPVVYTATFVIHGSGMFCIVLSLCNRLFPLDFPSPAVIVSQCLVLSGSIFTFLGYGQASNYWANGLLVGMDVAGLGTAMYMILAWVWVHNLYKIPVAMLTIKQLYVSIYVVQIIVMSLSGVVTARYSVCWLCVDSLSILVLFYTSSMALFMVGILPGLTSKCLALYTVKNTMEIKRILTHYVNHEIRAPLSVLLSGLELLPEELRAGKPIETVVDSVGELHHACNAAISICKDMIELENVGSGGIRLDLKVCLAHDIFSEIVRRFERIVNQKGLSFDFDDKICDCDMYVFVDSEKIESLLRNLILYACGSTPIGGFISVTIRARQLNDRLEGLPNNLGDEEQENDHHVRDFHEETWKQKGARFLGRLLQWLRNCLNSVFGESDNAYTRPTSSASTTSFSSPMVSVGPAVCPDDPNLRRSGELIIEVADSGSGLSERALARIQAGLCRVDGDAASSEMAYAGLGSGLGFFLEAGSGLSLGLWIASTIAQGHAGSIAASSLGTGLGTTLTFKLPTYHTTSDYSPEVDIQTQLRSVKSGIVDFIGDWCDDGGGLSPPRVVSKRRPELPLSQRQQQLNASDTITGNVSPQRPDSADEELGSASFLESHREAEAARRAKFRRNRYRHRTPKAIVPPMSPVAEEDDGENEDGEKSAESLSRIGNLYDEESAESLSRIGNLYDEESAESMSRIGNLYNEERVESLGQIGKSVDQSINAIGAASDGRDVEDA